jgi:Fe-S-cluster containining protein
MQHGLDVLERGLCKCEACKAPCKTMPGFLVPGDLERIAAYLDTPLTDEFIARNFRVASGGTVPFEMVGKTLPRPAMVLVPDQRPSGDCVFFQNGLCQIHPVAPFGCRMFEWCHPSPSYRHKALAGLLSTFERPYRETLMRVRALAGTTPPLQVRRNLMHEHLLHTGEASGHSDETGRDTGGDGT